MNCNRFQKSDVGESFEKSDKDQIFQPGSVFSLSQKQALHVVMQVLPKEEREILRLHYWESRSLTEIAKTLRMQWSDVLKLLESAHARLRELCLQHPAFKERAHQSIAA